MYIFFVCIRFLMLQQRFSPPDPRHTVFWGAQPPPTPDSIHRILGAQPPLTPDSLHHILGGSAPPDPRQPPPYSGGAQPPQAPGSLHRTLGGSASPRPPKIVPVIIWPRDTFLKPRREPAVPHRTFEVDMSGKSAFGLWPNLATRAFGKSADRS
jgi:hypothetical protein